MILKKALLGLLNFIFPLRAQKMEFPTIASLLCMHISILSYKQNPNKTGPEPIKSFEPENRKIGIIVGVRGLMKKMVNMYPIR